MDLWAPLLSCFLDFLRKMAGAGVGIICCLLVAIQPARTRINAGLCPLVTSYGKIRILKGAKPLRNGRMVINFGIFFAWKFVGFSMADNLSRGDSTDFLICNRLKDSSIILEKILSPIGTSWNEFEFFGSYISSSYTKSLTGPLVCGVLGVQTWLLDMLQIHIQGTFSTILEGNAIKNHREWRLFLTSLCERVFGGFSPLKLLFLKNEGSDFPQR